MTEKDHKAFSRLIMYDKIKRYYEVEHRSIRWIARETKLNFRTIKKYLKMSQREFDYCYKVTLFPRFRHRWPKQPSEPPAPRAVRAAAKAAAPTAFPHPLQSRFNQALPLPFPYPMGKPRVWLEYG